MNTRSSSIVAAGLFFALVSTSALAQTCNPVPGFTTDQACEGVLEVSPASWRIQNYVGDGKGIALWYTGSKAWDNTDCHGASKLFLPTTADPREFDRLWSTVLAAKLSGRKMLIYYVRSKTSATASACGQILSFGMHAL